MSKHEGLFSPVTAADHIQGDAAAPVTLVEYGDYECSYCGQAYPIVKQLQARLGAAMRFVFRNFPLAEIHPHAAAAAEMAEGAHLQGRFWPMHDLLYENQNALDAGHLLQYARSLDLDVKKLQTVIDGGVLQERVRADFLGGVRSGVNGTPTFFINGKRFDGNWTDEEAFAEALQAAAR